MIYTALDKTSNGNSINDESSVFIDLLTYQDLEILKARKLKAKQKQNDNNNNGESSLNVTQKTKNKRYLILTYVVEFSKVHYPLAVKFDFNSLNDEHKSQSPFPNVNTCDIVTKNNKNSNMNANVNVNISRSGKQHNGSPFPIKSYSHNNKSNKSNKQHNNKNVDKERLLEENEKLKQLLLLQSKQMELERQSKSHSHSISPKNVKNITRIENSENNDNDNEMLVRKKKQKKKVKNTEKQNVKSLLKRASARSILHKSKKQRVNMKQRYDNGRLSRQSVIESSDDSSVFDDNDDNDDENDGDGNGDGSDLNDHDYGESVACYNEKLLQLSELIDMLDEENQLLKTEIETKNLEIKRLCKEKNEINKIANKQLSNKMLDLEDEVDRLSTQLLDERTKIRRINKDYRLEKLDFEKKISSLEASNRHYKNKCKSLNNELENIKHRLDVARKKASQERLYHSNSNSNNSTSNLDRRSRSRTDKPLFGSNYNKKNKNKKKKNNNSFNFSQRQRSQRYQYRQRQARSLSTSRLGTSRGAGSVPASGLSSRSSLHSSRTARSGAGRSATSRSSRSPSIGRFDPTAWAQKRKEQIAKAKSQKSTFSGIGIYSHSRTPSPCHINSSSNSRCNSRRGSRSGSRNNSKNGRQKSNGQSSLDKMRQELVKYKTTKRNSFGRTISRSRSPGGSARIKNNGRKSRNRNKNRNKNSNGKKYKNRKGREMEAMNKSFSSMEKLNQLSEKLKAHQKKREKSRIKNVNIIFDDSSDEMQLSDKENNNSTLIGDSFDKNDSAILKNASNHQERLISCHKRKTADCDSDESQFNESKAIEKIDARLNALQSFLRAAKSDM